MGSFGSRCHRSSFGNAMTVPIPSIENTASMTATFFGMCVMLRKVEEVSNLTMEDEQRRWDGAAVRVEHSTRVLFAASGCKHHSPTGTASNSRTTRQISAWARLKVVSTFGRLFRNPPTQSYS